VIREALRKHTMTVPDSKPAQVLPQPFNEACWKLSQETRALTARPALPPSVKLYNVYGVGQETWVGLNFTGIQEWGELQSAKCTLVSADGDGTVPVGSARVPLMPVQADRSVEADHTSILTHPDTLEFLLDALYDRL
jgi:hypothetical protein